MLPITAAQLRPMSNSTGTCAAHLRGYRRHNGCAMNFKPTWSSAGIHIVHLCGDPNDQLQYNLCATSWCIIMKCRSMEYRFNIKSV